MKTKSTIMNFGKNLAHLRKSSGLTQQQLADKIGVSRRVIAYYEGETKYPPAHLIAPLSKALNITTDELLGVKPPKNNGGKPDLKLQRRMNKIKELPSSQQQFILKAIDSHLKALDK
ncbi:MAG: helix-turn-helix transcriptional regulator [Thermodesulfobacteriota bacterium]|jgi:transcriptional regulator with XRE-family HTH domain